MLDALPPKRVAELSDVLYATRWYPLQSLVDLDHAIVAAIGDGDRSVLRSAGRFTAAATLRHVRASLLREDPHSFLRHVALLQSHFADFGAATWERLGSTSGRMTHRHWRCFGPTLCESSAGFYEEAARMAGGSGATAEELSCQCRGDKHCSFLVRWR
jgi:predicted hydrocarbon binding protein